MELIPKLLQHEFQVDPLLVQRDRLEIEADDFEQLPDELFQPVRLVHRNADIFGALIWGKLRRFVE